MKIGAHVSIAGGIQNAPHNAAEAGCECFQMFMRSPHGGKPSPLTPASVASFADACKQYNFSHYYVHTPYYINLASTNNRIYYGSISVIRDDLERGSKIGVRALMTHLGSARELGDATALKKVAEAITKILTDYKGTTQFLIEMSAGAGKIIGDTFEEIAAILKLIKPKVAKQIGVCLDTCHAFTSGYDLRTKAGADKVLHLLDRVLGKEKLALVHANDSKTDIGTHIDRHEHIGEGKIGTEGFRALLTSPDLKNVDFVLETPKDGKERKDIQLLKKLRDEN